MLDASDLYIHVIDMKLTTITTLMMICGSAIGVQAQDTVPAAPIIPQASTETKSTEDTAKPETSSVAEQITAATQAYNHKSEVFMKKVRAEKDRAKMTAMYKNRPLPTEQVAMILKLAKADPKAEGIEKGLVWSLRTTDLKQREQIGDLLMTHYKDSKSLGRLAQSWMFDQDKLREIIENAGDETVRQGATYLLASAMGRNPESKDEAVALLKKLQEWPEIAENNERLLGQVNGDLFAIEKLSVGCEAPDIVGTDHEDKEFKLSDYKGQVVLLDFWGYW